MLRDPCRHARLVNRVTLRTPSPPRRALRDEHRVLPRTPNLKKVRTRGVRVPREKRKGAVEGDRELGDVTVRNFVGGKLNIMHHSDVDPHGVINGGIVDKAKKYAKPIADREISGCMALVLNAGGGMSKDFSDLIYRLARKRTERVLGPAPASGDNNQDTELLQEHKMHTAGEVRRMQGALQTIRVRGQVNLILRAPRAVAEGRAAPANTSLRRT